MAGSDGQVIFTVELDDAGFQDGLARMQAAVHTLGESVLSALTLSAAQWNEAYASGSQWIASFASGLRSGSAVATALKSAVSGAAAAASAAGRSAGVSVGQSIVSGIVSGVTGRSGALNAALTSIVASALAAARRAAGIQSPSALFRDQVGRYLALGVQSGFTDTMEQSVLPAINQSVGKSAAAGQQALSNTLLMNVQRALDAKIALPDTANLSAGVLRYSAADAYASGATAGVRGADNVTNVTQHITFSSAMQAPDEIARAIRRQAIYGLAGARG
ncbi:MAG: hypothetical protein LLF96_09745 [Eubacteriales bacterium]|nr:hypothetical protein [Eubacteriales bacterium]